MVKRAELSSTAPRLRYYERRRAQLLRVMARLKRNDRLFVAYKLVNALLLPAVFLIDTWRSPLSMLLSIGLLVLAFLVHEPLLRALREVTAHLRLVEGELRALENRESLPLPDTIVSDPDHPYDTDLNISGPRGLFLFLSRAETQSGRKTLQRWLLEAAPLALRLRRSAAIRELGQKTRFRERFLYSTRVEPAPRSSVKDGALDLSAIPEKSILPPVILLLPMLNIPALLVGIFLTKWWPFSLIFLVQICFNFATGLRQMAIIARCRGIWLEMRKVQTLLARIEGEAFSSELLTEKQRSIRVSGHRASRAIARLGTLLQCLDLRGSTLHPLINNLLFWDLTFISRLVRWRRIYGAHLDEWISVCGEWEALCSLATVHFNHPDWTFPEFVEDPLYIKLDGLGHPLLCGQPQVENDCCLPGPHHLFFITGPNMAGKSTFIRALATAIVMARAGAPIHARQMRLGPLDIVTSLSHTDSLSEGKSLFHKELDRLSLVWERCHESGEPVLFFFDEMLRGTNPIDRHNGSYWVLKLLARQSASGVVATHDLQLTEIVDTDNPGLTVQNAHFSCEITSDSCLFDYRLRPGTAPSVNALPLMRQRGFPIPL